MIWLYYLLCFANSYILYTLNVMPWNSWQWWASVVVVIGSNFVGHYTGMKF